MEALATELGLSAPLAPWHVCRDALAETVSFLGLISGTLAKIATDIILLAQTEVGEVAEPYVAGRGQSSTMPQKRNPIASEYILAAARMRANLNITHGLIVSEAVMMGLAPVIGRGEAHHVVKHACDIALAEKISLADALERDPAVSSRLDRAAIEKTDRPGQLSRQHPGLHRSHHHRRQNDPARSDPPMTPQRAGNRC